MAEYYPLISRAVAGLRDGAPDARHAIYGRAKQALVAQLRGMQPPVPEADINREITALDEAIARIESEITPRPAEASKPVAPTPPQPPTPPPQAAAATPSKAPPSPAPAAVAAASPKPQAARPTAPPVAGDAPSSTPRAERPLFTPRSTLPSRSSTTPVPRPAVQRPSVDTVKDPTPPAPPTPVAPSTPAAEPIAPPQPEAPLKPVLPVAATLDVPALPPEPVVGSALAPLLEARYEPSEPAANSAASPIPEIASQDQRARDEMVRPAVPRPKTAQPRNLRVWIVAVVALAAVVAIAWTAWKLRDRPEELARAPAATPQASETPGKIVERADGTTPSEPDAGDDPAPVGSGAVQNPAPAPATPVPAAATAQPAGDQAIPVSYKAAILVDAPDSPEKVKTYVGSVVWRTESVSQGQDQPLGTAIRADVDIPEAKIQLVMEMRKNTEAQFPASHTIDLKFTVAADSPIGGVKQINVPQMRREDMPTGDQLTGVPVSITNNYFLVGLTRGDAEPRNIDAIRTRGWFDIPMLLDNGKPAKITFEKGASGDRIINDALQIWGKS